MHQRRTKIVLSAVIIVALIALVIGIFATATAVHHSCGPERTLFTKLCRFVP